MSNSLNAMCSTAGLVSSSRPTATSAIAINGPAIKAANSRRNRNRSVPNRTNTRIPASSIAHQGSPLIRSFSPVQSIEIPVLFSGMGGNSTFGSRSANSAAGSQVEMADRVPSAAIWMDSPTFRVRTVPSLDVTSTVPSSVSIVALPTSSTFTCTTVPVGFTVPPGVTSSTGKSAPISPFLTATFVGDSNLKRARARTVSVRISVAVDTSMLIIPSWTLIILFSGAGITGKDLKSSVLLSNWIFTFLSRNAGEMVGVGATPGIMW